MHQLLYISTVSPGATIAIDDILRASQRNNARDGITGLLFYNGKRFLQALEGSDEAIARTIGRIRADPRHRAIVILSERTVATREFGNWAMADASAGDEGEMLARVADLVSRASPTVRATFNSYARIRRAA